jgi:hypothetical protein
VSLSWPQSFQKTHSNLICETDAIPLESERGNVSYSELLDYSIEMELLLKDYNFQNVWNWDESSDEPKSYSSKRVFASIAAQNKKISYKMKRHAGHITYLWCICADGDCLPPLIIISQLTIDDDLINYGFPVGYLGMVVTTSGYINEDCLTKYLNQIAIPYWNKKRKLLNLEKEPILLLQDSMSSHINDNIKSILEKNKIDHYEFPAHSTHLTQPLDGTIFSGWKKQRKNSYNTTEELTDRSKRIIHDIHSMEAVVGKVRNRSAFRFVGFDLDFSKQRLFFDFTRLRERNGFPTHKDGEIEISQPKRKIHRVKLNKSQSKKEKNSLSKKRKRPNDPDNESIE